MKRKAVFLFAMVFMIWPLFNMRVNAKSDISIAVASHKAKEMLNNINSKFDICNPIIIKNINLEDEIVSFDIDDSGYIFVNINDLTIPEFSINKKNPFKNIENPIYNGLFRYYYLFDDNFYSATNGEMVVDYHIYHKNVNKSLVTEYYSNGIKKSPVVQRYLQGTLQTWINQTNSCGAYAAAICMRYYYDYIDNSYLDSSNIDESSLVPLMQQYVGQYGTTYVTLKNGINSFFNSNDISNTAISNCPFNFSVVKSSIITNKPIIVGTENHPVFGDHWLIAHGYFESRVDGNYIIVNNGLGSNDIWVYPDTQYIDGTISFNVGAI